MKKSIFTLSTIILGLLVLFMTSCEKGETDNTDGTDNTNNLETSFEITGISEELSYSRGSSIDFQLAPQTNDVTSIAVMFSENEIGIFTSFPCDVTIDLANITGGAHILKLMAFVNDSKVKTEEISIEIIEPETTEPVIGSMTDIDGNEYTTVKIGTQTWMAENLKVKHYRNGDAITNITDNDTWANAASEGYCHYENDASLEDPYGCLYNFYAANDSRGIAPEGWHIPSRKEMNVLIDYLGGYKVASGKLKEEGNEHWNSPLITDDNEGTNESGFSGVAAGTRTVSGQFQSFGYKCNFWLSNETTSLSGKLMAYTRYLGKSTNKISEEGVSPAALGFSIRCIKD